MKYIPFRYIICALLMTVLVAAYAHGRTTARDSDGDGLTGNWYVSTLKPHSEIYDVSYLNDPPAGKHGFLKVDGDGHQLLRAPRQLRREFFSAKLSQVVDDRRFQVVNVVIHLSDS